MKNKQFPYLIYNAILLIGFGSLWWQTGHALVAALQGAHPSGYEVYCEKGKGTDTRGAAQGNYGGGRWVWTINT